MPKNTRRGVGHPIASAKTVRVMKSGMLRLSPDLCTAKKFDVVVSVGLKTIMVKPGTQFKLFKSRPTAKSGLLYITAAFREVDVEPEDAMGEYRVLIMDEGFLFKLKLGTEENGHANGN